MDAGVIEMTQSVTINVSGLQPHRAEERPLTDGTVRATVS